MKMKSHFNFDKLSQDVLDTLQLTFQQQKNFKQWSLDCQMWQEPSFFLEVSKKIKYINKECELWNSTQKRNYWYSNIQKAYYKIKSKEKIYPLKNQPEKFPKYEYKDIELKGNIFRTCPAASVKTVCCNLKVLNLVNNCAMECSYCVLQNHYDEALIEIPVNLKEKLSQIRLNPHKKYRICTGEYSDSLMWGNKNNILDDCCSFAEKNPNIILEFKTKSSNIEYFLKYKVPKNICCSWSLNPPLIIDHEEKKTASFEKRILSARKVADLGIKVAFHLHPMMYFQGWKEEYQNLVQYILKSFKPQEILWISFGCVTLMKGFEHKLRENYLYSKILQMETEVTQDNKITYAFEIREKLYRNALTSFLPWKNQVFQYLCMEPNTMWDKVMDYTYKSVADFEEAFNQASFPKVFQNKSVI